MRFFEPNEGIGAILAFFFVTGANVVTVHASELAGGRSCIVQAYEFSWTGQFAGFMVNGRFSFDGNAVDETGIVREQNLLAIDVSFYDPLGNHLRTYYDNQDLSKYPTFNFAFNTRTRQILQNGTWKTDNDPDDLNLFRNGFMMGEGDPDLRHQEYWGSQTGLAFWSRPGDDKVPHLHVDDWNDVNGDGEFGFPIGFSSHEDAGFMTKTTQDRADTGKIGPAYYEEDETSGEVLTNNLASDFGAFGQWIQVVPARKSRLDRRDYLRCLAGS